MRIVRRFYFYLVAFISLEVVIWGLVTLVSSFINAPIGGGLANLLAQGLSQVIVGLPIFWLHWRVIINDNHKVEDERHTRIRALFLYGLKFATLGPILINLLAVVRRLLTSWMNINSVFPPFLASQQISDNLISIGINIVIWYYAEKLLEKDWTLDPLASSLRDTRRIYRYLWLVISIGSLVIGVEQVLAYLLNFEGGIGNTGAESLITGIALSLIAAPLWVWTSRLIQRSLDQADELYSNLRLVVLFILSLSGIAFSLSIFGMLFSSLMRWLIGEANTWIEWINRYNSSIALLIPFSILWGYYGRGLRDQISKELDVFRKAGISRLYRSIVALGGNAVVFTGLIILLNLSMKIVVGEFLVVDSFRNELSGGLACLVVGLPLWIINWLSVQKEANLENDLGDHARQSVIRKGYLYLSIFALVVGLMSMAGYLAFRLLNALLGNPFEGLLLFSLQKIGQLAIITLWLVYHLRVLRLDGKFSQRNLKKRHADFTTLLIVKNQADPLINLFSEQINRQLPDLTFLPILIDNGTPVESLKNASALVVAAEQMESLPSEMRTWFNEFTGQIVVLPISARKYNWVGMPDRNERDLVHDAIRVLRQLAEGQQVKSGTMTSAWAIASNILAVLFLLQFVLLITSFLFSMILN